MPTLQSNKIQLIEIMKKLKNKYKNIWKKQQ